MLTLLHSLLDTSHRSDPFIVDYGFQQYTRSAENTAEFPAIIFLKSLLGSLLFAFIKCFLVAE